MLKGWVNTLMAGAGLKKASRGSYTAAGYVFDEVSERELYIERVQAGSAQDLLRDNNRLGYSAEELDGDGLPFSFFMEEKEREEKREETNGKNRKTKHLTFTERLARAVRRERGAVILCCTLMALNLVLLSFWGQAMIDGVRKQETIALYQQGASDYQREIDQAKVKIARAQDGERIRNAAQNELGMLRKERVASQTIYIQKSALAQGETVQYAAEESGGLLDWLLSVADIFDFKS